MTQSPHRLDWEDCLLVAEAARAKGDLESWVGWLQAAAAAAGDADTAARLRRLAGEAVATHDEAALRYGRLTWRWHGGGGARPGEAAQLPTLMRIEPFNATLAAARRATVRRWRRRHAEFLARFPMFRNQPRPEEAGTWDRVAYRERMAEQCQQVGII